MSLTVGPETEVKFLQPNMDSWPWLCLYCKSVNTQVMECYTCGAPNRYVKYPIIIVKNPATI